LRTAEDKKITRSQLSGFHRQHEDHFAEARRIGLRIIALVRRQGPRPQLERAYCEAV
jgi:hypothetical protein